MSRHSRKTSACETWAFRTCSDALTCLLFPLGYVWLYSCVDQITLSSWSVAYISLLPGLCQDPIASHILFLQRRMVIHWRRYKFVLKPGCFCCESCIKSFHTTDWIDFWAPLMSPGPTRPYGKAAAWTTCRAFLWTLLKAVSFSGIPGKSWRAHKMWYILLLKSKEYHQSQYFFLDVGNKLSLTLERINSHATQNRSQEISLY